VFAPAVPSQGEIKICCYPAVPLELPLTSMPPPPSMFRNCDMKKGKTFCPENSGLQEPQCVYLTVVSVAHLLLLPHPYRKQRGVLVTSRVAPSVGICHHQKKKSAVLS